MPHPVAVHGCFAELFDELVVGHGPHGGPDDGQQLSYFGEVDVITSYVEYDLKPCAYIGTTV